MGLKVLLAVNKLKGPIKELLIRSGYEVVGEAGNAAEALRKARSLSLDIVIMDAELDGGRLSEVAMILEEDGIAPVLMLISEPQLDLKEFCYVLKPVNGFSLIPAIESAILNYRKRLDLLKEVERLRNQLATRKLVDIAKGMLMKTQGYDEEQAHRALQKMSMDKGIPLKALAEAVIAANSDKHL
jgi:response regulator NasT